MCDLYDGTSEFPASKIRFSSVLQILEFLCSNSPKHEFIGCVSANHDSFGHYYCGRFTLVALAAAKAWHLFAFKFSAGMVAQLFFTLRLQ